MKSKLISAIIMLSALIMGNEIFASEDSAGDITQGKKVKLGPSKNTAIYSAKRDYFINGTVAFHCWLQGIDETKDKKILVTLIRGEGFAKRGVVTDLHRGNNTETWHLDEKEMDAGNILVHYVHGNKVSVQCIADPRVKK